MKKFFCPQCNKFFAEDQVYHGKHKIAVLSEVPSLSKPEDSAEVTIDEVSHAVQEVVDRYPRP